MRGKGYKLGEGCPKVRSSQNRMPIEPLPLTNGWVRGNGNSQSNDVTRHVITSTVIVKVMTFRSKSASKY